MGIEHLLQLKPLIKGTRLRKVEILLFMISDSKISEKLSLCFCCTDQGGPDSGSFTPRHATVPRFDGRQSGVLQQCRRLVLKSTGANGATKCVGCLRRLENYTGSFCYTVFDERSSNICCTCTLEISRAFDSRTLDHARILRASIAILSQLITKSCSLDRVGNRYIARRPAPVKRSRNIQSRPSKPTILFMMYSFEEESHGTAFCTEVQLSAQLVSVMKHLLLVLLGGLALLCRSIRVSEIRHQFERS